MFQIIFNEISAAEMSAMPKELQLDLLAEFQLLPEQPDKLNPDLFGKVAREGRALMRYRSKEYRIYFERHEQGILVHRVLHKNTLQDFLFRSNLPLSEEDEELAKAGGFWKLIDEGNYSR